MKKYIYVIITILTLTFISGCDILKSPTPDKPKTEENSDNPSNIPKDDGNTGNESSSYSIKDYYPFKENVKYTYEGKGMEFAFYTMWVDFVKNDKIQIRTNNGGTEIVKVLQNKNGELNLIFSREECYYREDFTSKANEKNEILLKEPLKKGTAWTLDDGRKRYISNVDVSVSTPLGDFKALEVTTEDSDGKTLDYYAINKGLVKTVYTINNTEITSTLSKLQDNTPLTQTVKFFYPNINDDKLYFSMRKLTFNTNDITKMVFEKYFKEAPSKDTGKLLSPKARINSMYLNKDGMVYVDFTKEFVTEMNAGSGYEGMILQCITNTIGQYYGESKVYITVEGKPYSSGHIVQKKGEPFTVDSKGSIELK